jgi:hypothetical protein
VLDFFRNGRPECVGCLLEGDDLHALILSSSEDECREAHAAAKVGTLSIGSKVFEAQTVLVSCGARNFEQTCWSLGRPDEFGQSVRNEAQRMWSLNKRQRAEFLIASFRQNYPDLCEGRKIILINCLEYDDRDNEKDLRSHVG